jgi:REP element-mobilizing transposase RayT
MAPIITEYPQFFTATNLGWKKLLKPDKYKDIVISSLRFLVNDKRAKIFAFVIMENHIHLIWQMLPDNDPEAVQRDFLKYTAQRIKKDLQRNHPEVLAHFKVEAKDRGYPRQTGRAGVLETKPIKCRVEKPSSVFAKA